jgi:hypothetical protein
MAGEVFGCFAINSSSLCASSLLRWFHVGRKFSEKEIAMRTIILVILILLLLGALPTWPYSTGWGYYPSGGLGLVLVIVIILALMGRL